MNFYDLSAKLRAIEENASKFDSLRNDPNSEFYGLPDDVIDSMLLMPPSIKVDPNSPPIDLLAPTKDPKWLKFAELMKQVDVLKDQGKEYNTVLSQAMAIPGPVNQTAWFRAYAETLPQNASNPKIQECGDMMSAPMMSHAPQQQDSVTMNVSMNGSGAGGIKDLMSILRNIEQSAEHDHAEPMIAQPHGMDGDVDIVLGTADEDMLSNADADESYGNSAPGGSDAHTYGIDAVTRKGDDMHSKGDVKRLRVNGGENPLQEALVERLSAMYQEIKEAKGKRTMSRAAKGYAKYGKKGMKALADAGREGKDLEPIQDKFNKYK
jgi:hypothetical protein